MSSPIIKHTRDALACLGPGKGAIQAGADLFIWEMQLLAALDHLSRALAAANAARSTVARASVLRMQNWIGRGLCEVRG